MQKLKLSLAVTSFAINACANESELLNSDRIAERFGSFGIEIVSYEDGIRRSSLYSVEGDKRICRTYAVVQFQADGTQQVPDAHADVLAGQSIGSRFRESGWTIRKETVSIGTVTVMADDGPIGSLMHLAGEHELAVHEYRFILERDDLAIDYATITETHHPDYLSLPELQELYGSD